LNYTRMRRESVYRMRPGFRKSMFFCSHAPVKPMVSSKKSAGPGGPAKRRLEHTKRSGCGPMSHQAGCRAHRLPQGAKLRLHLTRPPCERWGSAEVGCGGEPPLGPTFNLGKIRLTVRYT